MTWSEAEKHCAKIGDFSNRSHLVFVDDVFEWSFILSKVHERGLSDEFWIGLSDSEVCRHTYVSKWISWQLDESCELQEFGKFVWSSASDVLLSRWGHDEPSNERIRACVSMKTGNPQMGAEWHTRNCNTRLPFVCKATNCPFSFMSRLILAR